MMLSARISISAPASTRRVVRSAPLVPRAASGFVTGPAAIVPPAPHGPYMTESWAEEVCELKDEEGGHGKELAVLCAQALEEVAKDEKVHPPAVPARPFMAVKAVAS